jgi:drug/metabolite transporter (DMT)-like permease
MIAMIGVALLWSVVPVYDKIALRSAGVPVHGFFQCAGIALLLSGYLLWRRDLPSRSMVRENRALLGLAVLSGVSAIGLQFMAIQVTLISLFEAIKRGIGMSFALIFGRVLFKEPLHPLKIIAIFLMISGIFLII